MFAAMRAAYWTSLLTVLVSACSQPADPAPDASFRPVPAVMPRLTAVQYRNVLKDAFGGVLPAAALEPDTNPYLFFSIGAATTTLSEAGVEQYADAAARLTDLIFDDADRRSALVGCQPLRSNDFCVEDFLRRIGLKLHRRPLGDADVARWLAVVNDTADGDPYRGLRMAVYGLLQSPRFLYRVELGEPDPSDHGSPPRLRYDAYDMAQRLSFLLWDAGPDQALLAAAEQGELLDAESLRRETLRMLESPRARKTVQSFFDQFLNLGTLARVERDRTRFPAFTPTLAAAMRTELQLLADDLVFRRDVDIRELFSTRRTFVNAELAAHYQIAAPAANAVTFVPVELPADGPRAGLLTLGGFLLMNAHPTESSPTLRGKYILERILCQLVPPPPSNVNLDLGQASGMPRTLRQRLEEHRKNPACAGCHAMMDPPGFLFEAFDPIGGYRPIDQGLPVDTQSEVSGRSYRDGKELGAALRENDEVGRCLVRQFYRHANARLDLPADEGPLAALTQRFAASGYRFRSLILALVQSEAFRYAAPPEVQP